MHNIVQFLSFNLHSYMCLTENMMNIQRKPWTWPIHKLGGSERIDRLHVVPFADTNSDLSCQLKKKRWLSDGTMSVWTSGKVYEHLAPSPSPCRPRSGDTMTDLFCLQTDKAFQQLFNYFRSARTSSIGSVMCHISTSIISHHEWKRVHPCQMKIRRTIFMYQHKGTENEEPPA